MQENVTGNQSAVKKVKRTISSMIARVTVNGCILLGVVALIMGLGFYSVSRGRQYITLACNTANQAAINVQHGADVVPVAQRVMEIYRGLSEEDRQKLGTDEYRDFFAEIQADPQYQHVINILGGYLEFSDVYDVYLAMYDRETCTMVYIVDPEEEDRLYPGEWEAVTEKGMEKFLEWNGEGQLYDIDRTAAYGWLCTAGAPITDDRGETVAFVLTDISLANLWHGMNGFVLRFIVTITILTFIISRLMSKYIKINLVDPLNEISAAAIKYVSDRKAGRKETGHFNSLKRGEDNEVEALGMLMYDMEKDLNEYEENLTRITAETERINTELSLATRLQAAFIPHKFPAFPDRTDFELYGVMDPAKEVGGDFYDFFLIDADHLGLVMADVSGKGVPAALFMMVSKIILQSCAMLGKTPAEILKKTNEAICSNNQEDMFVTVWVGILELSTGMLSAANAGHEYPAFKYPGGKFELFRDKHGFIIGGMPDSVYQEYQLRMEPGTELFLYTDGVPEATDSDDELFGTDRMLEALNKDPDASPRQLLENVSAAVNRFVSVAEQFDDLTMLCIRYNGKTD